MSELTPERIRDAAEVISLYERLHCNEFSTLAPFLRSEADRLERDQAAEAKREKRVDELTDEVIRALNIAVISNMQLVNRTVRHLIARYPALADGPES